MNGKDGKYLESVVHVLEKSLNPDAKVHLDLQLPILNSREGATTQCDIVIVAGQPPRQTTTIIEVQDRTSKPSANDFRGWIQKLDDVGAQHLICVSKKGFTKSTIEKAGLSNNKIQLLKLSEFEENRIPLEFLNINFNFDDFEIFDPKLKGGFPSEVVSQLPTNFQKKLNEIPDFNEKCYSLNGGRLTNLYCVCRDIVTSENTPNEGKTKLNFKKDLEYSLTRYIGEYQIDFQLEIEFNWTFNRRKIKPIVLSYEQNEFGILAWYVEFVVPTNKGTAIVRNTVVPNGKGFAITSITAEGPEDFNMELKIEKSDK